MNLDTFLATSKADPEFKAEVQAFASGRNAKRIHSPNYAPSVKVMRVIAHLLSEHPDLMIQSVTIDGVSGCSDFRGTLRVQCLDGVREYEFAWDCKWRAMQVGWTDHFGFPDQIRAAREFGHRCFRTWTERAFHSVPA